MPLLHGFEKVNVNLQYCNFPVGSSLGITLKIKTSVAPVVILLYWIWEVLTGTEAILKVALTYVYMGDWWVEWWGKVERVASGYRQPKSTNGTKQPALFRIVLCTYNF